MAEDKKRIDLRKDVFDKAEYIKTIDTRFTEFGVKSIAEQVQDETSVEEFFQYYNELFYEIPAEGETNSHRYLVIQSGEYINFDENLDEIEALREEIARLRTDLLELQIKNIELETGASLNIDASALKDQINGLGSNIDANNASLVQAQEKAKLASEEAFKAQDNSVNTTGVGYF
jgi:hypothetical protein|tara:strand:+ start:1135 stop:1659 length:525 start_codon:yes stop_codon:yes gene_type:complete